MRASLRNVVHLLALVVASHGLAQTPSWRDGTLEQLPRPLMGGNWVEQRRTQQERDRADVERLRDSDQARSTWVWTEAPVGTGITLWRGTPSARTPNR